MTVFATIMRAVHARAAVRVTDMAIQSITDAAGPMATDRVWQRAEARDAATARALQPAAAWVEAMARVVITARDLHSLMPIKTVFAIILHRPKKNKKYNPSKKRALRLSFFVNNTHVSCLAGESNVPEQLWNHLQAASPVKAEFRNNFGIT
jgi:hypothetical protein